MKLETEKSIFTNKRTKSKNKRNRRKIKRIRSSNNIKF